jgi:predicted secreted protein
MIGRFLFGDQGRLSSFAAGTHRKNGPAEVIPALPHVRAVHWRGQCRSATGAPDERKILIHAPDLVFGINRLSHREDESDCFQRELDTTNSDFTGKTIIFPVPDGYCMENRWIRIPVPALALLFLLVLVPGCLTNSPPGVNLTAGELADHYLLHAGTIREYRSEYIESSGMTAENRFEARIRFDYKSPSFARMEVMGSGLRAPGSFATTNGTSMAYYDAETRTYDTSSGLDLRREYDYQEMVRRIVADRNFTILDRDTTGREARYLIEVATVPWSTTYTTYVTSRIRAWIEPSTGLAWNITTYYDCNAAGVPTPTPPPAGPVMPESCSRSEVPNREVRYELIEVNTGIPDSYFDFVPPEGSGPRCVPKYVNYVEPLLADASVPIRQPLPGGVRYSLNESDSGRTVALLTGEVLEITLRTIPGLAYRWIMPAEGSGLELMNAGPIYEMPVGGDFYQGRGYYRWRFLAVSPGTERFDGIFALDGCDIENAKRFNLTVQVIERG